MPDAPYLGVLIALAVGDQRSIPSVQWKIFNRVGITHLVSISGLHVTMVAALFAALVNGLWRRSEWLMLRLPAPKAVVAGGWLAAFVYCAGAALRLARFNANIAVVDKRYFQGLPSPAAAALVAGFVLLMDDLRWAGADLRWFSWSITLYAGLMMVSNLPFYSFKDVNFRKSVPFIAAFLMVLAFVVVASDAPKVLFGLFVLYGLSGYGVFIWRWFRGHSVSIVQTEPQSFDVNKRD
jgi:predicted membrane metal-binding protein